LPHVLRHGGAREAALRCSNVAGRRRDADQAAQTQGWPIPPDTTTGRGP